MIRHATIDDLKSIVAIYNEAIIARFQTGFTEPLKATERKEWLLDHVNTPYPLFVHTIGQDIAGWVSLSPYRQGRDAFRYTVEISYFISKEYQGQGIGKQLLQYALDACRELNYKTIIAIILDKNAASIKLVEKFGFKQWAHLPAVADFNGVECDHYYYGLKL